MSPARRVFWVGARGVIPLAFGVAAFGLVVGATASESGLDLAQTVGFSVFVFAGASQLAAIDLIDASAPVAVTVGTALVINSRMLMYSASLAPQVSDVPRRRRLAMAYLLVDQVYAMAITRWEDPDRREHRFAFYLGTVLPLWTTWQLTTVLGAIVGSRIPEDVPISFSITLVFLAVLVPTLTDRPRLAAAAVAGTSAVVAQDLPANLALPLGAVLGIAAGAAVEARWGR